MHISFLPILCDPKTQEGFELEITESRGDVVVEGRLRSSSNSYPIVRGIPRFAGYDEKNYSASFGYQWNKWSRVQFESENRGGPMEGHTRGMWEKITGIRDRDLSGSVFLDCGCGPGRFLDVVTAKNGRAIGVDMSDAVEAAARNFRDNPNVLICQGDVLHLPIRPHSVDGAFSIGVFHHTPDPRHGFEQMSHAVRPGGEVAVCVYGKGGYYDFPSVTFYRKLFGLLKPLLRNYPPLIYSYFTTYCLRPFHGVPGLGKLMRLFFPYIPLADKTWSLLDTFDSVTPTYQSAHESYEVYSWLKDSGLVDIEPSDWGFAAYHGKQPPELGLAAATLEKAA
ncbi:MAG: class I SAM-dependent methyltransferase [Planctomycetales bacterium]|nr:class I SAM-dependent methyltransferase [Planctomycetales bacterium]